MKRINVVCLDNGGETFDRYTIIERKTGEMLGASSDPYNPQGFGQYCGNVAENYWRIAYGYGWRERIKEKEAIKFAVNHFLSDCAHVGKRVKFSSLPDRVKSFARERFAE